MKIMMRKQGNGAYVPPTNDPYFSNVELLAHFDGNYTDSSSNNRTLTPVGNTNVSVSAPTGFGNIVNFDGSGDYITVSNSSTLNFGTGDFTVEARMAVPGPVGGGANADRGIFGTMSSTAMFFFLTNSGNAPAVWDGSNQRTSNIAVPTGVWTHVAFSRTSGILKIFVNGIEGLSVSHTTNMNNTSTKYIGGHMSTNSRYFAGYMDELRITKGVGRYTTDFTPPTVPFFDQ